MLQIVRSSVTSIASYAIYTVSHLKRSNLNWFVSMIVPRASVMGEIDASTLAIRTANKKSIADGDKKQESSLIITICVAVGVAVVLMALSVVMTSMILAPLKVLEKTWRTWQPCTWN